MKMSCSQKKSEQEHIKRVTRKFLEVSHCSRAAKQRQRNELKKCAARAKLLLFFFWLTRCNEFLAVFVGVAA